MDVQKERQKGRAQGRSSATGKEEKEEGDLGVRFKRCKVQDYGPARKGEDRQSAFKALVSDIGHN